MGTTAIINHTNFIIPNSFAPQKKLIFLIRLYEATPPFGMFGGFGKK